MTVDSDPNKQTNKILKLKMVIIFISIDLNMYSWCSKESSHRDGSFEYQQHMFWLRNEFFFIKHSYLNTM